MTNQDKIDVCIRELLFGESFLDDYGVELSELASSPTFLQFIEKISASVSDEIEFSKDNLSPDFIKFKKDFVSNSFYTNKIKFDFPAYKEIYNDIIEKEHTGLSATISVYYAIRYFMLSQNDETGEAESTSQPIRTAETSKEISDYDFRKKWPASFRCEDGHYVRSKNEQLVDNWLYHHNICHGYEPLVIDATTRKEYISDFYIPKLKVYVEVWGIETAEYLRRKENKINVYKTNNLGLLQITDNEIKILDDYLRRSFLALSDK